MCRVCNPAKADKRLRRTVNRLCRNNARVDWADPVARRAHLGELVELARALLAAAGHDDLAEAADLLARIVDQDVEEEPADGGGPAIRRGRRPRPCGVGGRP